MIRYEQCRGKLIGFCTASANLNERRTYMTKTDATRKHVCWVSEKDLIISFHYEEGYIKKEFDSKADIHTYIILAVAKGYRVQ